MNKNRIITTIGVVLLITGAIGSIWSGIYAVPKILSNIQISREKFEKEEVLYNSEMNLTKLNIDTKISDVTITKYNGKEVIVKIDGNRNLSTVTTIEDNNELTINEEVKNDMNLPKNIDDIVRYFLDKISAQKYSSIIVYVPENIDINANMHNSNLYIDDMALNNINFNTSYGNLSLGQDSQVKNLNIKSTNISLNIEDIYCADNVEIESNYVEIYGNNFIKDEAKIPESIKISTSSDYYDNDSVSINTKFPIAKNLYINSNSNVSLDLPLLDYKFNFDIKTSRGIDFRDYDEKYRGTVLEKYFNYDGDIDKEYKQKEFIGLINEELKDNLTEYNINVKSSIVEFN